MLLIAGYIGTYGDLLQAIKLRTAYFKSSIMEAASRLDDYDCWYSTRDTKKLRALHKY